MADSQTPAPAPYEDPRLSQREDFLVFKTLNLAADGSPQPVPINGNYFNCVSSTSDFEMTFDGQNWFAIKSGRRFNKRKNFSKLSFRSSNSAAVTIQFYAGNVEVVSDSLIIVAAKTKAKGFAAASIGAGVSVTFYGTGGSSATQAGAGYLYRKSIEITNNDPGQNIQVYAIDGTTRLLTVLFLQARYLETSDDVIIKNSTGAAIAVDVCELFYLTAA